MAATAGIVIIGDEILSGKFDDENARFLIRELDELGVALERIAFIRDAGDDIAETVRSLADRYDYVFTSGGVGPTHDDVTIAGIAQGFGVEVEVHPVLQEALRAYYGDGMPAANRRLAEVPAGAELVYGDARWPVVCFRNVYILPGVPSLFRRKFTGIRERFRGQRRIQQRVYALGDEGALAPHLDSVVLAFPSVKIGSYPRFEETAFRVILTLEGHDSADLEGARDRLVELLGDLVVRVEG